MRAKSTTEVQQFVERQPEGAPFSPTELLLYGTRASIDQALSRWTKDGVIERVARGVYVKPKRSRIVGKVPPSPVAVAKTYARAAFPSPPLGRKCSLTTASAPRRR